MDWIDDNVALGTWLDSERHAGLQKGSIDLVIDARMLFRRKSWKPFDFEPRVDRILRAGDVLLATSNLQAKALVHCVWGKDRTPFVVSVYVSKKLAIPMGKAYELVKLKHPQTVVHQDWIELLQSSGYLAH